MKKLELWLIRLINKNRTHFPLPFKVIIRKIFLKRTWASDDRYCSNCGNTKLGKMVSMKLRYCPRCNNWFKVPKIAKEELIKKSNVAARSRK